jgi:prepilin-type N-terminal cleavage/methylation domain-containing protein
MNRHHGDYKNPKGKPSPPSPAGIGPYGGNGFSILELMVAMAVMAILVVILMGLVDNATRLWRQNENRVESYREARAALNLIASDLRRFHSSTNTNYFTAALPGMETNSLGFLAALPKSAQNPDSLSELCTVGYYSAFGPRSAFQALDASGGRSFNIYRRFRDSNDTFSRLTNSVPALFAEETFPAEILARNIAAFSIRTFMTNASGTLVAFEQSTNNPVPTMVEVSITAMNNEFAARLGNSEGDWQAASSLPGYENNIRVFSTRIPIRQP